MNGTILISQLINSFKQNGFLMEEIRIKNQFHKFKTQMTIKDSFLYFSKLLQ